MKKSVTSTLTLVCICAVIAVMLAITNAVTAPIIEQNNNAAANEALLEVMPEGKNFTEIDVSAYTLPQTVTKAYSEDGGGYVFQLTTTGYASGFNIMCGVNADGTVSGATCLSSGETLGYEKTFGASFTGKNAEEVAAVDTISGATRTTSAYRAAVADSINAAIILGGGSVDLRSEEEILRDNLSAALPAADGKFIKVFIVEDITGIDAIYEAENSTGYVCVVGDEMIATDMDGNVLTETSEETAQLVSDKVVLVHTSFIIDIDLTEYTDLPSYILEADVTESGNYIVTVRGAGYGINGGNEYHPASGEYIVVRVSMTPDGRILDCYTVSQAETDGIGSVCADPKFYSQFVGKTEDTCESIDAISGATLTTNGYKQAILRAFEAVTILEGGAN